MAKKSKEVEGGLEVVEVVHPNADEDSDESATAEWNQEQNQALLDYKVSGRVGKFIDPKRDQEPDIAPELGVAPHPELANPVPPKGSPFLGQALDQSRNAVVVPFSEKVENASEAEKAAQEAADAFNKANQEQFEAEQKAREEEDNPSPPEDISAEDALNLHLLPDESAKAHQGDARAKA